MWKTLRQPVLVTRDLSKSDPGRECEVAVPSMWQWFGASYNNILKIGLLWEHYEARSLRKAAQALEIE